MCVENETNQAKRKKAFRMIKINPEEISKVDMQLLCMTFLDAIKEFYKDPENQRKFEEWKKEMEQKNNDCLDEK